MILCQNFFKVFGTGYAWSNTNLAINAGDTVTWSWSSPSLVTGVSYQVVQVADAASTTQTGFSSGNSTSTGIQFFFYIKRNCSLNMIDEIFPLFQGLYSYQFNTPGTYYIWSGYVNNQLFSFRGIVQVNNAVDKYLNLNIKVKKRRFHARELVLSSRKKT